MSHDLLLETILAERRRQTEMTARERLARSATRTAERDHGLDRRRRWAALRARLAAVLAGAAERSEPRDATPDCCDGAVG